MSLGEEIFLSQCHEMGVPEPEREYIVQLGRKWSFDFCWPDKKIAVEIEGGVFSGGRHTRPKGFINDIEKYNTATCLGWRVFRFTTQMVKSGEAIEFVSTIYNRKRV